MKVDFGRWTATKAALAVAGGLAIAGAIGSAVAISPTIAPPIRWQGGAEFRTSTPGESGIVKAYTVPAGRNFLLTDITAANLLSSFQYFYVSAGAEGSCDPSTIRMHALTVRPLDMTVLAFQTGIGFSAGQAVCIWGTGAININGRGFLFTAAPAS